MTKWLGILIAVATMSLVSCDGLIEDGPSHYCEEAGRQCVLPAGPLGVCERTRCRPGEEEPCFQCTPQH